MAGEHERHAGDPAAYLLGALSDFEREAFERHRMACPICRDELEHLRPAAEALPRSVAPVRAPVSLKRSVMEAVEREAAGHTLESEPARRGWWARVRGVLSAPAAMRPSGAWVGAALVLAFGVAFGAAGAALLSGDEGRTVAAQVDEVRLPEASGSLTVSGKKAKGAILRVHGMPSLGSRQTYQVWTQREGEVVSQSIFDVGESGEGAAAVPDDLEGVQRVLVTREPAGGARAPSGDPVVSVEL